MHQYLVETAAMRDILLPNADNTLNTGQNYNHSFDNIILPPTMNEEFKIFAQYARYKNSPNKIVHVLQCIPDGHGVQGHWEYTVYWRCNNQGNYYDLVYYKRKKTFNVQPGIESGELVWEF